MRARPGRDAAQRTSTRPGPDHPRSAVKAPTSLFPEEKQRSPSTSPDTPWSPRTPNTADPIAKVTILPAGQALGVTEQLPLGRAASLRRGLPERHAGRPSSAAGRASSSSSARARRGQPTTWPRRPSWPPRWSGSSASPRRRAGGLPLRGPVFLGMGRTRSRAGPSRNTPRRLSKRRSLGYSARPNSGQPVLNTIASA